MTPSEYYDQHEACPRCKSVDVRSTCVGYIGVGQPGVVDRNKAVCEKRGCGWVGIVNDLVKKP